MMDLQRRVHALHTEMIQLGQDRGEIRGDFPATEIAQVFRQTIFGTLLMWSLYGDATLHSRIEAAFNVLWTGLAPGEIRRRRCRFLSSRVETSSVNRKRLLIVLSAAAIVTATALYAGWFHRDTALQSSGTVEARNIRVGSKIGGRIDKVLVREGDAVQAGQVLITFDEKELQASLEQSRANAEKVRRGYRPEEIAEARANAAQAKADYELKRNGYRQEDVAAAQADLDRAKADETRTHLDFDRYEALAKKDLVSKQQRDSAEANWKMALAQQHNARQKLDELQRGYRPEEIASAEAHYHQTQANMEKIERGNRREDVDLAKAAYSYDEARFRERQVTAPPPPSSRSSTFARATSLPEHSCSHASRKRPNYVRIYIPETEYGRLKLGQKAEVRVDAFPNKVFEGVLEQINQQAEFLPRNVQTREERVHQVLA